MNGECDSLTGSYLISLLITAACSNLNEESRVSYFVVFSRTKYFNDHSKYSLKWFGWKIIKTIFTPPPLLLQHHYVLTGPRNGSYTLGQVILARKRQREWMFSKNKRTTRTKSALTILRTASTWTRPTRHWCHTQFRSILCEGWDNKIVLE